MKKQARRLILTTIFMTTFVAGQVIWWVIQDGILKRDLEAIQTACDQKFGEGLKASINVMEDGTLAPICWNKNTVLIAPLKVNNGGKAVGSILAK
jgi:hypothetical protein